MNIACAILNEHCRHTLDDFHPKMATQYSYFECHCTYILTNELEIRKVCAHWVPRELSNLHWKERMGVALEFLTVYQEEGDALFDCIITRTKCGSNIVMSIFKNFSIDFH